MKATVHYKHDEIRTDDMIEPLILLYLEKKTAFLEITSQLEYICNRKFLRLSRIN